MANRNQTMEEIFNRHLLDFSTRFFSVLSQLAEEGIGLTLPIVVIEPIYDLESNLGIKKAQARKCVKEVTNIIDSKDEDYFALLKVNRVAYNTEENGVLREHIELMMILNWVEKVSNYSIFHELNNRVERRLK